VQVDDDDADARRNRAGWVENATQAWLLAWRACAGRAAREREGGSAGDNANCARVVR
jgi:hypothetical protein